MIRCPFHPPAASVCPAVGALHRLNGSCQCVEIGEDHLDHKAACGARWSTVATGAQVAALRIIEAQPGIRQRDFVQIRESRGIPFRLLEAQGWVSFVKRKAWSPAGAVLTEHGRAALAQLAVFTVDREPVSLR